ncbi:MAG: hypothetical protein LBR15_03580 [Methanobrevibacter sp.]|nr:hypothetical protein [Candidatus Methanovirga australis]
MEENNKVSENEEVKESRTIIKDNVKNELINRKKCKYKCVELYKKGFIHIVDEKNNIIGKCPVWKVLPKEDINNLFISMNDLSLTYDLSKHIHELEVSFNCLAEALFTTNIKMNFNPHFLISQL